MHRLTFCTLATIMLMTAAPAGACAPPSIEFGQGSARIDARRSRWAIDDVVSEFRVRRRVRVELSAQTGGGDTVAVSARLARRRGQAVKAALVRRGIPARAIDVFVEGERQDAASTARLVWMQVVAAPARNVAGRGGGCSG